jgi:hypothetical protein
VDKTRSRPGQGGLYYPRGCERGMRLFERCLFAIPFQDCRALRPQPRSGTRMRHLRLTVDRTYFHPGIAWHVPQNMACLTLMDALSHASQVAEAFWQRQGVRCSNRQFSFVSAETKWAPVSLCLPVFENRRAGESQASTFSLVFGSLPAQSIQSYAAHDHAVFGRYSTFVTRCCVYVRPTFSSYRL